MRSYRPTRLRNDPSEWLRSLPIFVVVRLESTRATDYKVPHKTLTAPRVAAPPRRHSIAVERLRLRRLHAGAMGAQPCRIKPAQASRVQRQSLLLRFHQPGDRLERRLERPLRRAATPRNEKRAAVRSLARDPTSLPG